MLVIGQAPTAQRITRWFNRHPHAGLRVTGVWLPDCEPEDPWLSTDTQQLPVIGQSTPLTEALRLSQAGSVIVSDVDELGDDGLRDLTWELEEAGVEMLLSPNLVAVAGSRIAMRQVAGMPFVHVREPQYAEAGNWPKLVFDRVGAAVILLVASPCSSPQPWASN